MADSDNTLRAYLDFTGKHAVITGVLDEDSIAWPIAKQLHDAGARVALSIQRKAIRRLMGNILKQLDQPLVVECDVTKDDAVDRMANQVGEAFGIGIHQACQFAQFMQGPHMVLAPPSSTYDANSSHRILQYSELRSLAYLG